MPHLIRPKAWTLAAMVAMAIAAASPSARADCGEPPQLPHNGIVTLDVERASIQHVLSLIAEEGEVSIIVDGALRHEVTLRLRGVELEHALGLILCSYGLSYSQVGDVIVITADTD